MRRLQLLLGLAVATAFCASQGTCRKILSCLACHHYLAGTEGSVAIEWSAGTVSKTVDITTTADGEPTTPGDDEPAEYEQEDEPMGYYYDDEGQAFVLHQRADGKSRRLPSRAAGSSSGPTRKRTVGASTHQPGRRKAGGNGM